jgi:RNA polymerase sigma-70 factor (ECF subfamily)
MMSYGIHTSVLTNTTDEVLMGRFRKTLDDQVFGVLAARYYDRALGVARERLGSLSGAQDAVQETLIRVVRHRKQYRSSQPFAPWFYSILRNVCTDLLRKEIRHRDALKKLSDNMLVLTDEESDAARERIMELTSQLRPGEVELLGLRYAYGFSVGEIAQRVDASLEATKKRLQRLLKQLKK